MNRKGTLALCLVTLALTVSLTAVLYSSNNFPSIVEIQDSDNTQRLATSVPIVLGAALHGNSNLLNQPTRIEIYTYVKNNPGVHFRGIARNLVLSIGVVQYHLDILVHAGLLKVYSDGQNKRYFVANAFKENDAKLIMLLRHQTAKNILSLFSREGSVTHKEISQSLSLSSQAVSWQMNQLRKTDLIKTVKEGVNIKYILNQKNAAQITLFLSLYDNQRM